MKVRHIIFNILVGTFRGYLRIRLQKRIDKHLEDLETSDNRGGGDDGVGSWLRLLETHKKNLLYVLGILGVIVSTGTIKYNVLLSEFIFDTTFPSLYQKAASSNLYIKALELTPGMTNELQGKVGWLQINNN